MLPFDFPQSNRILLPMERRYHNGFLQTFYNLLDGIFLRKVPGSASNGTGRSDGWYHRLIYIWVADLPREDKICQAIMNTGSSSFCSIQIVGRHSLVFRA